MLGLGKVGTAPATAAASSAGSRVTYQRYAATLYRQALLTLDEGKARPGLTESVFRRLHQLLSRHPAPRLPGQRLPGQPDQFIGADR